MLTFRNLNDALGQAAAEIGAQFGSRYVIGEWAGDVIVFRVSKTEPWDSRAVDLVHVTVADGIYKAHRQNVAGNANADACTFIDLNTDRFRAALNAARARRANNNRRAQDEAARSLGLRKVRGAMGGTYYE